MNVSCSCPDFLCGWPSVRVGSLPIPGGPPPYVRSRPIPGGPPPPYVAKVNAVFRAVTSPVNLGSGNPKYFPQPNRGSTDRKKNPKDLVVEPRHPKQKTSPPSKQIDQGLPFDLQNGMRLKLTDSHQTEQRKKQVLFGEVTEGWLHWQLLDLAQTKGMIPKEMLTIPVPPTPEGYSKRGWDSLVAAWRRDLHAADRGALYDEFKDVIALVKETPEGVHIEEQWRKQKNMVNQDFPLKHPK